MISTEQQQDARLHRLLQIVHRMSTWKSTASQSWLKSRHTKNTNFIIRFLYMLISLKTNSHCRARQKNCLVCDEDEDMLTVQTLPDGLETQFTPFDTTQTGRSCLVWQAV